MSPKSMRKHGYTWRSEHLYTDTVLSDKNFRKQEGTLACTHEREEDQAKIRHSVEPQEGIISSREGLIQVKFDEKQRAATSDSPSSSTTAIWSSAEA